MSHVVKKAEYAPKRLRLPTDSGKKARFKNRFWIFKFLAVFFVIFGPSFAYSSWQDSQRIKATFWYGVYADAKIVRFDRKRSGRREFFVSLSWKEINGTNRNSRGIEISDWLANELRSEWKISENVLAIKYIPGKPLIEPVAVRDYDRQVQRTENTALFFGFFSFICGIACIGMVMSKLQNRKQR